MNKSTFTSLMLMEERIADLLHNALRDVYLHPFDRPRYIAVTRHAIKKYGPDDSSVIHDIRNYHKRSRVIQYSAGVFNVH